MHFFILYVIVELFISTIIGCGQFMAVQDATLALFCLLSQVQ